MSHDRDDDQPAGPTRPGPEQDARALDAPDDTSAPDALDDTTALGALDDTDMRIARLVCDAARDYRVPPPPPVEAMWARIEAGHFDAGRSVGGLAAAATADATVIDIASGPRVVRGLGGRRHVGRWGGPALGLAAGLLLGVGIGAGLWRSGAGDPSSAVVAAADRAGAAEALRPDPAYETVAIEYFDQAVALLASLPATLDERQVGAGQPDARLAAQARDLLSTTRLLLDSPAAGSDPQLQSLLDDLELVLAQVVRLPAGRDSTQAALINEALETRDMLPRLRTAAAQASAPATTLSGDE